MDTGAIVGLSLGLVVTVLLIIALLLYCCSRKPRERKPRNADAENAKAGFDNPLYENNDVNVAVSMKEILNQDSKEKKSDNFSGGRERFPSNEMGLFVGQKLKSPNRTNSFTNPLFEDGIPSLASQSSVDLYNTQGPLADLALDMSSGTLKIHGVPDSPDESNSPAPLRSPNSQRKVKFSDHIEVKIKTPSSSTVDSESSPSSTRTSTPSTMDPPGSPASLGKKVPPNKPRRGSSKKAPKHDSPPISRLGITMDAQVDASDIKIIRDNSHDDEKLFVDYPQTAFANPLAEHHRSGIDDSVRPVGGAHTGALNPFGMDNFADYSFVSDNQLGFVDLGDTGETSTDDMGKLGQFAEPASNDSEERADKLLEIPLDVIDLTEQETSREIGGILEAPSIYKSINLEIPGESSTDDFMSTEQKAFFDAMIPSAIDDVHSNAPISSGGAQPHNVEECQDVVSMEHIKPLDLASEGDHEQHNVKSDKNVTEEQKSEINIFADVTRVSDAQTSGELVEDIVDTEETRKRKDPVESHDHSATPVESQLLAAFEEDITPESITDTSSSFVAIDPSSSGDSSPLQKIGVQGALVIDTSSNLGTPHESPALISPIVPGDEQRKSSPSSNESADDSSFMMVDPDPNAVYAQVIKRASTHKTGDDKSYGVSPEQAVASSPVMLVSRVADADQPIQIHELQEEEKERSSSISSLVLSLGSKAAQPISPTHVTLRVLSTSSVESEDESGYARPYYIKQDNDPNYERLRFDSEPRQSTASPLSNAPVMSSSLPETLAPPCPLERVPETTSDTGNSSEGEPPPLPARPASMQDLSMSFEAIDDPQPIEIVDRGAIGGKAPDLSRHMFQPESEFAERLKKRKEKQNSKDQQKSSKKKQKKNSTRKDESSGFGNLLFEDDTRIKDESKNMPMVDVPLPVRGKKPSVISRRKLSSSSSSSSSNSDLEHISDDDLHNISDTLNLV